MLGGQASYKPLFVARRVGPGSARVFGTTRLLSVGLVGNPKRHARPGGAARAMAELSLSLAERRTRLVRSGRLFGIRSKLDRGRTGSGLLGDRCLRLGRL